MTDFKPFFSPLRWSMGDDTVVDVKPNEPHVGGVPPGNFDVARVTLKLCVNSQIGEPELDILVMMLVPLRAKLMASCRKKKRHSMIFAALEKTGDEHA
jgi:hypothetical protein